MFLMIFETNADLKENNVFFQIMTTSLDKTFPVAVFQQKRADYACKPPFDPPQIFPETPFAEGGIDAENEVYQSVREIFRLLGYDLENYGKPNWNPLGWLIKPGETIFLKPNMIAERHYYKPEVWNYVITHGSLIRAVADFAFIALQGAGKIIIGDAPSTEADFDKIIKRQGLREIQELFRRTKNFEIEILDLRDVRWVERDRVVLDEVKLAGDPRGKVNFNLAENSLFAELDGQNRRYYGAFYDTDETNEHHRGGRHDYSISRSAIEADVFINLPKLKTHKKCGLTVNLKSLVGINANKNWLPHYAFGSPATGGDQFPAETAKANLENAVVGKAKKILLQKNPLAQFAARKTKNLAYKFFGGTEEVVRSGNWHGNDTVWRMCLDLNRVLLFGQPDGEFRPKNAPKRFYSLVDGIVAMDGNGPVAGEPKNCGILIAGSNPTAVDFVCARLMNFDYRKIKIIARAFDEHRFPLFAGAAEQISVVSNEEKWRAPVAEWTNRDCFNFEPHFGWRGFIELAEAETKGR
jgi:uncharacterized protein (DUF362 family)